MISLPLPRIAGLLRKAGVDRAVGMTLFGSGWNALAGAATILLISRFLSPDQQGYYYTFSGFLGATVLFELGLSYVILQFASHEWADLEWTAGTLGGAGRAKGRLARMLYLSLLWYGVIALLILATVLPAGFFFFARYTPPNVHVAWQLPWLWIALVSAGTLMLSPLMAVLEGCGLVAQVAARRAVQSFLASLLIWAALVFHWGLYAAPIPGMVMMVYSGGWLWRNHRLFLRDLLSRRWRNGGETTRQEQEPAFSWRREVWPFQWKIALSGISSYFIYQLFTPVLMAAHGPAASGRMGMSLSISGAIAGLALSWVSTKSQPFGTLIAERNWKRLDEIFFPALWRSWAVSALGGLLFWASAWFLQHQGYPISRRLLPPLPLGLLIATVVVNHLAVAEALYLRAHKQEPFLWLSLVVAALVALCALLLGRPYGATGMMLGYFLVSLAGVTAGTWVFVTKRRQWHSLPPA